MMEPNSETWKQEGEALALAGHYAEALDVYTEALRLAPDDALIHHHQSYVLNELKRYEEALGAAGQANTTNVLGQDPSMNARQARGRG